MKNEEITRRNGQLGILKLAVAKFMVLSTLEPVAVCQIGKEFPAVWERQGRTLVWDSILGLACGEDRLSSDPSYLRLVPKSWTVVIRNREENKIGTPSVIL